MAYGAARPSPKPSNKTTAPEAPRGRPDLAWRHATDHDLDRISHIVTLGKWRGPLGIRGRADRLLAFLCALHRCGRIGYQGTRASLGALCRAVGRATRGPASRSTIERAIAELVAAGYVKKSRGRGARVRQIGPDSWIHDPLVILTLTDKARAVWNTPGTSSPAEAEPEAPEPAAAPPAAVSPSPPTFTHSRQIEGETTDRAILLIQDMPARAIDLRSSVSPSSCQADEVPACAGSIESRGLGTSAAPEVPGQSARALARLAELGDCHEGEPQATCQGDKDRNRAPRSQHPNGTRPTSRRLALDAILATLADVTRNTGRRGAMARARAAMEIAGGARSHERSGVPWDYWIATWRELTRDERRAIARSEIVPLLLSTETRDPGEKGFRGCPTIDVLASGHTWTTPAPPASGGPAPPASAPPGDPPAPSSPADFLAAMRAAAASGSVFARRYLAEREGET